MKTSAVWRAVLIAVTVVSAVWAEQTPKLAGSEVERPQRSKFVAPEYPPEAQATGARGIVILELVIDTEGRVEGVEVIRSVPPFDQAAVAAARQWEYEVTRVDGRPVPVRLTVPITFALRLPELSRGPGVPRLRRGSSPTLPASVGVGEATVRITLAEDGQVLDAIAESGEPPWTEALLKALRSWQFELAGEASAVPLLIAARFEPSGDDEPAKVSLRATALQAGAGPSQEAGQDQTEAETAPTEELAEDEPAVEVIASPVRGPAPTPAPTPTKRTGPGQSSVRGVSLGLGVPDLSSGRRPVVPPFARMAQATGEVEVEFSVSSAGRTKVHTVEGPDLLEAAAEQTVGSWIFERLSGSRLYLVAVFTFVGNEASASVALQGQPGE